MILVVEGISAAGKTTLCKRLAPGHVIAEGSGPVADLPDGGLDAARQWTRINCQRWSKALRIEAHQGLAVCDTDPLKLHYAWSLWQIGEGERSAFERQRDTTRSAVARRRLGFADRYIVIPCDVTQARLRRDMDPTRRRHRFDLHVRLQEPLVQWYSVLGEVVGRPVYWTVPGEVQSGASFGSKLRYDLSAFDAFMTALERL